MRINLDLKKLGAHGGPGLFFSQLARQCYMGNSCNHEHEEEIKEDTHSMYLLYEEERKIFAKIYLV